MFNGIIYNQGKIVFLKKNKKSLILGIKTELRFTRKDIGSSVCCDGACLTLLNIKNNIVQFYLSIETLNKTKFKNATLGEFVNLERSLKYGDEVSGHFLQGHIDTIGRIQKIKIIDKSWFVKIVFPQQYSKFIVEKGSIGINGVSLTVSKLSKNVITLTVIPHTLKLTNLLNLKTNSIINIELDIFAKYLKKINN
ncbi:MAG: riboflavin synthase [Pelagibacterales bacterium]|jgi:riboflavin synthase|nr:riboflavin synthase [Pelagibacterales bacterium]